LRGVQQEKCCETEQDTARSRPGEFQQEHIHPQKDRVAEATLWLIVTRDLA
jgi:hypothetical protein